MSLSLTVQCLTCDPSEVQAQVNQKGVQVSTDPFKLLHFKFNSLALMMILQFLLRCSLCIGNLYSVTATLLLVPVFELFFSVERIKA